MQLNKKTKDILSFIGRIALSVGILFFVFSKIDTQKTLATLKAADLTYIVYAFLLFILCNVLLLLRWVVFIRALDLKVEFLEVTRYFFAGLFGNLFLPTAIGGDIIKILGLCRNNNEKAKVVASVLVDRLSGYVAIVIVPLLALGFGSGTVNIKEVVFMVSFLGIALIILFSVLFNAGLYGFFCRVFNKLPKVKNGMMNLHYNISLLKDSKKRALLGVAMASLGQILFALTFALLAKALNQEIRIIYFLIFVPLTCVASVIPSIGGLGVREAGAAYLFNKIGVETGVAVSMSLINYLFMTIVGLFGGLIYVFTLSSRRVQSDK